MGKILIVSILAVFVMGTGLDTCARVTAKPAKAYPAISAEAKTKIEKLTAKKVASSSSGSLFKQTPEEVEGSTDTGEPNTPDAAKPTEIVDEDANEGETEELDPHASWEAPGGNTPMAKDTKDMLGRCIEVIKVYHDLVKVYGFTTPDAEVCALGDAENGGKPICLGATRGQPCETSGAGAEGPFQVKRKTANEAWATLKAGGTYNPQKLEDNMAVAIHFLETMKKNHGENRFRAYNGGGAIDKDTGLKHFDRPGNVREKTLHYDQYVRNHIPVYQAALDGKVDFQSAEPAAMAANMSPPIPFGTGYISGIFGESRAYRGKDAKHMGMDMAAIVGTDVLAITDGLVAFAGEHTNTEAGKRAGKQIQLTHGDGSVGKLGGSRYFHLATVLVKTGDRVRAGQKIGTVGLTGVNFSGAHLNFESYTWGPGRTLVV